MKEDLKKEAVKVKKEEDFDIATAYVKTFRSLNEGDIVKGKVIAVGYKDVYIDFGYKSEGIIPVTEFEDLSTVKIGDEFDVLVESKENEDGLITVSKKKA